MSECRLRISNVIKEKIAGKELNCQADQILRKGAKKNTARDSGSFESVKMRKAVVSQVNAE